jgi:hypothetical protein
MKLLNSYLLLLFGVFCYYAQVSNCFANSGYYSDKSAIAVDNKKTDQPVFIENIGQWQSTVLFFTKLNGTNIWITRDGIVYDFNNAEKIADTDDNAFPFSSDKYKKVKITGHVVKMNFAGMNEQAEVIAVNRQNGYYNYFIGNDSSKWSRNVALYREVYIKHMYEKIDTRLYFDKGNLRYDLIVAPYADLQQIKFHFEGQTDLMVNKKGDLVLKTCLGDVEQNQIYAYQQIDGQRKRIDCKFTLSEFTASFDLKNYDPSKPLIIDPIVYSTFLGGTGYDGGYILVKKDSFGYIYTCGETLSNDFPLTTGAYQTTNYSSSVFVTKLNAELSGLVYSTLIGGNSSYEYPDDMDIDNDGYVYITGVTNAYNFPVTAGVLQPNYAGGWGGGYDGFVTKLNQDGSGLIFSTYIGGSASNDWGISLAVDDMDTIFLTGVTNSYNFPVTPGAFQVTKQSYGYGASSYVSKINPTGTMLVYSTFLGGSGGSDGYAIATDNTGKAYISGGTTGDFPTTQGSFDPTFNGTEDAYISILNSSGTALVYSTYLGGTYSDRSYLNTLSLDNFGNVFLAGYTSSDNFPITNGSYQTSYKGSVDAFILKLNPAGSGSFDLVYSTYLGGSGTEYSGNSLDVDVSGNVFYTGYTNSDDFPVTPSAFQANRNGGWDVYLTKLNASGSSLLYSSYLGGINTESVPSGFTQGKFAYISGFTGSPDFPVTPGAFDETFNGGGGDIFVTKLDLRSIFTGVVSSNVICAGTIISVPFIVSDLFNSSNVFTAQLSDSDGSFTSPVNIGLMSGVSSGSINAAIPSNTPYGNGYRLRVIGSSPLVTGSDNGSNLIVNSPTVAGQVSGGGSFFFGTEINLNLEGNDGSVSKWQKRWNGGEWQDIANVSTTYADIPDTTGVWDYRAEVGSSPCSVLFSDFTTVTVLPVSRTVNLTCFLEGLYNPSTNEMIKAQDESGDKFPGTVADKIQIRLARPEYPFSTYYTVNDIDLNQDGSCTVTIPRAGDYYLVIKNRNSIETWSSAPVSLLPETVSYDFSASSSQAYGDNMKDVSGKWAIWSGDVNQDGIVDAGDMNPVDNATTAITFGYVAEDVNGDGIVDAGDMNIVDNNTTAIIMAIVP